MPIADDPFPDPSDDPHASGRPDPSSPDPFDGLVLDEAFVRGATVKEPSARTRMLTARWRLEPPVDPGGRRWSPGSARPARSAGSAAAPRRTGAGRWYLLLAGLAVVAALAGVVWGPQGGLLSARDPGTRAAPPPVPGSPRPAADVALPGGGVSDGSRCGTKGYHRYALPPGTATGLDAGGRETAAPGPRMHLGAYGVASTGASDPGRFTFDLEFSAPQPVELTVPSGVAVEIEGPDGLVGGAHDLPVRFADTVPRSAEGRVQLGPGASWSAEVVLPAEALCPGFDAFAVQQRLAPPTDASNTITGRPAYTLTVSVSDPAIGAARKAAGSPVTGDVLGATNLLPAPEPAGKPV
ncbi:hypothetical protein [Kitasatospora camelliae]|uniref:Uncharacterized protein n=1 Tax=Kitasatospora camelliae TaxID=3156397 RepID=A0AAU8JPU3_9ACTN